MRQNKTNKKKTRVVIYIRYSSQRQAESFSIEYQLSECKKFCEQNGYTLVEVYIDKAKSGKKVAGRDEFDRMIYDAGLDKFDKIIVFSFSRSFRNTRDALNYNHDLMEKYDIMIESVIERIDMSDPHGKFSGTNLFAMHELQADIIAAHVKSGMYFAAQQGYYLGGYVPFGYELYGTGEYSRGKERRKYRPSPTEAPIVRSIFSLYAEGFSIGHIQSELRKKDIRGRRGDIISVSTLQCLVQNPFYIGTRLYKVKGYDPLTIHGTHEPIIDMDTWHKVQAIKQNNKEVAPRKTKKYLYSLTGKIVCAECGGHFHGSHRDYKRSKRGIYAYYLCSNKRIKKTCKMKSVRKDKLEEFCLKQIKEHILNEEAMRSISEQIATTVGDSSNDMLKDQEKAQKRKDKISGILKRIKRDAYEGEISEEMAREMASEYEDELFELENTLTTLKAALRHAITPEGVYAYLQELLTLYGANNDELTKMLFTKLVDKIVVHDDRVEVYLVVSPFTSIGDKKQKGLPYHSLSVNLTRKEMSKRERYD